MPLTPEGPGQVTHAFGRPAQGQLEIAPGVLLDQPFQVRKQRRIFLGEAPASPNPRRVVVSEIPVARATAAIPPTLLAFSRPPVLPAT